LHLLALRVVFAVRLHEFGPPANLRYEQVGDPCPGAGEVRVAVSVAGVHFFDTQLRSGAAGGVYQDFALPLVLGLEVAGEVDAVGPDVDPGWLGRRVVSDLGTALGGYAELAVAPAGVLHPIPPAVDHRVAVTMIATGRTALVVIELGDVRAGDVVLVTAAAGGVGSMIVQEVISRGATVVGAASGDVKLDWLGKQGAIAVDYQDPAWTTQVRSELGGRDIRIALDSVGGEVGRQALELVGRGGHFVIYGRGQGNPPG
jgi:NADPH2:quinone reductase